jgi:threonine dehydrogenase-like Zn-dependent dehydrogenase
MKATDWSDFLHKFEVPGFGARVYVLGCFARHLTLYSQQVRALNLIRALCDSGRIGKDIRVAVIGAGAAGLTTAAAAAVRKANVTVFERLDDVLEFQANNRQRFLHPHIYDWPDMRDDTSDAGLPLLNWQADYAASVAAKILQGWETLVNNDELKNRVRLKTGIDWMKITLGKNVILNFGPPGEPFDIVILAVGFGLERHEQNEGQWSYWSEDDIDGDFRRPAQRPTWLVSGTGDGALTDIMRLCIHRFRHANILSLVEGVAGVEQLQNKLRVLHKVSDEETLQKEFLGIDNEELRES